MARQTGRVPIAWRTGKTNRWPPCGSRFSVSCTTRDSPAKPLCMSVCPVASQTRTPTGIAIIVFAKASTDSSPPENIKNSAQRLGVDITVYPHQAATLQFDLDHTRCLAPTLTYRLLWHRAPKCCHWHLPRRLNRNREQSLCRLGTSAPGDTPAKRVRAWTRSCRAAMSYFGQ
jgi:hypothetical protein